MQLLALSGSLRAASSNTALLRAAAGLAPAAVPIILYDRLGELPHFSPDLQDDLPPAAVSLRAAVARADGLLISCPEYAHGVPGSFKNALDWLVGGPEFLNKPDQRGGIAHAATAERNRGRGADRERPGRVRRHPGGAGQIHRGNRSWPAMIA